MPFDGAAPGGRLPPADTGRHDGLPPRPERPSPWWWLGAALLLATLVPLCVALAIVEAASRIRERVRRGRA